MSLVLPRWLPWVLALSVLAGCGTHVVNPVTGKTERTVMDERAELAEGKKAHEQVKQAYGVYNNPRLQAYVNELGQKLAAQSHRANIPWTFTVLDSPEINAFALPGGYVYVTRGILAYMESEADMAGVIGHEIGHVTARHGAQRATRQQNAGLGVLAATVLGAVLESQGVAGAAQMAGEVSQGVAAGYVARYSREQELQADTLGAEYLSRSQYSPSNMVDVIQVLKSQEQYAADVARAEGREVAQGNSWLASHPSNDERLASIRRIAAQYKAGRYGDDGRERYLKMIDGMNFGESPDQGLTRGQNFYHAGLGIALTAPEGWRIQNAPDAVTLINAQADAALKVVALPPNAGTNHEALLRSGFKATQGQVTRGQVNGFQATHFQGSRQTSNGQAQPFEATLVTGPQQRVYALAYLAANAAARKRALPALNQAEKSFRGLSAIDQRNARPWQVEVVRFPAGGFAELEQRSARMPQADRQMRLLNGLYGNQNPLRPGDWVKLVVERS
jgi:predicted Zn-dependent protease